MGLFEIGLQELALHTSNSVSVCPTQKQAEPFSGLSLIPALLHLLLHKTTDHLAMQLNFSAAYGSFHTSIGYTQIGLIWLLYLQNHKHASLCCSPAVLFIL